MKKNAVSEKIIALMDTQHISTQNLSDRSGLTVSQIELVLSGEKVPSLGSLIKIARALGVRVGTFLDDTESVGAVVHRKNTREIPVTFSSQLSDANSHLDFYALAGNKADRHMEPFLIEINPSTKVEPILSSHEGEEFIFVMKGSVKIIYGKDIYILNTGDSIYYDSIVEHLVSAANSEPAQILAVVYAPL